MNRKQRRAGQRQGAAPSTNKPAPRPAPQGSLQTLIDLGHEHHVNGRLAEAEQCYRQALTVNPRHPDLLHWLGLIALQSGAAEQALALIDASLAVVANNALALGHRGLALIALERREEGAEALARAVELHPGHVAARNNLGSVLRELGRPAEALEHFRAAIALEPRFLDARNNLGRALMDVAALDDAILVFHDVLALSPDFEDAANNLAICLSRQHRYQEAEAILVPLLQRHPDFLDARQNLGSVYQDSGYLADAEAQYRAVLTADPSHLAACKNLGRTLIQLGRAEEALPLLQHAAEMQPKAGELHVLIGRALGDQNRFDEAIQAYYDAARLSPADAELYLNRGNLLRRMGRLAEAEIAYRQSLDLAPDSAGIRLMLSNVLLEQGRMAEARTITFAARDDAAINAEHHSALIFNLDYMDGVSIAEQQAERRRWAQRFTADIAPLPGEFANPRDPERRLRIGYVSADMYRHSAAWIFGAIIAHHDAEAVEVVCYSGGTREDEVTDWIRKHAHHWRPTLGLKDEHLAQMIRADGIDILIDLSAHTAGNRLLSFARKPAPIQLTGWGHANGTGLTQMDGLIVDPIYVPPAAWPHFAETILPMSCLLTYQAPDYAPAVVPTPAVRRGQVSFGSFNRAAKVNDHALHLWASILQRVPDSRLVLKDVAWTDASRQDAVSRLMAASGIAAERIVFLGHSGHGQHLAAFAEIDIALDPFPYGGGISTADALWMGVPVVCLLGDTPTGRVSASLVSAMGEPDLVATSPAAYRDLAVALAQDVPGLANKRHSRRERMAATPLGNPAHYAREAEAMFRRLWRNWCATGHPFGDA